MNRTPTLRPQAIPGDRSSKRNSPHRASLVARQPSVLARPPPIIIPCIHSLNTMIGSSQLRSNNIFIKDNYSIKAEYQHPHTPHARSVSEIPPLIQRCNQFIDYEIVEQPEISELVKSNSIECTKKTETLSSILKILTDPISRRQTPTDVYIQLFEMVTKHIFCHKPFSPDNNEFSETKIVYSIKNWEHIKICHEILKSMMNEKTLFSPFIDKSLCRKLIEATNTPINEEQKFFESIISNIIENFPSHRKMITKILFKKSIAFLDGSNKIWQIKSILNLLLVLFAKKKTLAQKVYMSFRVAIFPLIMNPNAYQYESQILSISTFFQAHDCALSIWCFKFLDRYWPISSPKKELLFLKAMAASLPLLPSDMYPSILHNLLRRFGSAIASPHLQVSLYTIFYCNNDSFIQNLRLNPEAVIRFLLPAVRIATNCWKLDAQEIAKTLLSKLTPFERICKPCKEMKKKTYDWNQIRNLAKESEP